MILGVDHVALSCADVHRGATALTAAGFRIEFSESNLANVPAKRALLRDFRSTHAVAFARAPEGPALELTHYGAVAAAQDGGYEVLMHAMPPQAVLENERHEDAAIWQIGAPCADPVRVRWPEVNAWCWYDRGTVWPNRASTIRALMRAVTDTQRAEAFWRSAIGAQTQAVGTFAGRRWARLHIPAPFPHWSTDLLLRETGGGPCPRAHLDDAGFPCLALLTSNIDRDADTLVRAGAVSATGTFEIAVNARALRIAMLRGPCDSLIELIEIRATGGRDR